jgi:peptidoglycan/xylan/chitin deacetylase (PgdA/CDA1 family)
MTRADIKRLGRPLVAALAHYGGYCALAGRLRGARAGRILSYHGISVWPANPYAVSSDDFVRQIVHLADQFVPISVDELVLRLRGGEPLPERSVALTIDDGYADIHANAYPILAQYAIPATIFLPVDFIGTSGSADATARMSQTDFLAWDQIREMSRNGISFGSHAMSHLSLTRLTRREVQHQLESSRATIEDEIGRAVTGFAYPYGTVRDFNAEVAQAVAQAGYLWAVTGVSGVNTPRSDLFTLRRTKIERGDGMQLFERAVRGALDPWVAVDWLGRFVRPGH